MILDKLFGKRSIQNPAVPLTGKAILDYFFSGSKSRSGTTVSTTAVLGHSPVWQAVSLLSGDVSKLDPITYRRLRPKGREEAPDQPAYRLLRSWTGEVTANIWRQAMMAHALLYGNAYSIIARDGMNDPEALEFCGSDRVTAKRLKRETSYEITGEDGRDKERHGQEDIFHLRGLTFDALGGLSLVGYARDVFGRNLAMERYGDDFFSGSAIPSGFFQHPGDMSPEAQTRFLEAYQRRHAGEGQRFRAGMLVEGMEWKPAGITPEDALLVDQLKFGVLEVARLFNLPPHKLGDSSKIAYKSIEEENRAYHDTSLGIWLRRIECEADDKLFAEEDKRARVYFVQFNRDDLYRPEFVSHLTGLEKAVQNGIMTRNEARERLQLNPIEGGDEPILPLNMKAGTPPKQGAGDNGEGGRAEVREKQRIALVAALVLPAKRILTWAAGKANQPSRFLAHVNEIGTRFGQMTDDHLAPVMQLIAEDSEEIRVLASRCLIKTIEEFLLRASECAPEDLAARVDGMSWSITRVSEQVASDIFKEIETHATFQTV